MSRWPLRLRRPTMGPPLALTSAHRRQIADRYLGRDADIEASSWPGLTWASGGMPDPRTRKFRVGTTSALSRSSSQPSISQCTASKTAWNSTSRPWLTMKQICTHPPKHVEVHVRRRQMAALNRAHSQGSWIYARAVRTRTRLLWLLKQVVSGKRCHKTVASTTM